MAIGLALSGGGFRATLFHLGVIAFLRDAGKLSEVTHITSVSGGSILSAHLVLNWESYTGDEKEFDRAANELLAFVRKDIRGRIYRHAPMQILLKTPTDLLVDYYSDLYGHKTTLAHLDGEARPSLYLLTTNLTEGTLCSFTVKGFQDEKYNRECACESFSLGRAVAASSAFPGLFPCVLLTPDNSGIAAEDMGGHEVIHLTDGGVYDNLGLRKFQSLIDRGEADVEYVVVSDASAHFKIGTKGGILAPLRTSLRAADILSKRIHDLELKLAAPDKFILVQIGQQISRDVDRQALSPVIQKRLESIRTDLDKFSELEIAALVRHGYCCARLRIENGWNSGTDLCPPWDPLPESKDPRVIALRKGQLDECETIRQELDRSSVRKLRLMSLKDPISYIHLALLFAIIAGYLLIPYLFLNGGGGVYVVKGKIDVAPGIADGITLFVVHPKITLPPIKPESTGEFEIKLPMSRGQIGDLNDLRLIVEHKDYEDLNINPAETNPQTQDYIIRRDENQYITDPKTNERILIAETITVDNIRLRKKAAGDIYTPTDSLETISDNLGRDSYAKKITGTN